MLVEETPEESSTAMPGAFIPREKPLPTVVSSRAPGLGALSMFCLQLYQNLLTMDPELEKSFPSLRHQAVSMAGVMSLAVNSLENLASLDSYLTELGKRHSRILGIEPPQFEMMGEALIQTFVERFGTKFTHELEVLWIKFYMYLANLMLQFGIDPVLNARAPVSRPSYADSLFSTSLEVPSMATLVAKSASTMATEQTEQTEKSGLSRKLRRKRRGDCVVM